MTWYALCEGQGLRQCSSCRRNADNQPLDSIGEHQSWCRPHIVEGTSGSVCGDWMAIPRASREDML